MVLENPKFGMQKQCLLMGFIRNIKQRTIDHNYSNPYNVLVDFETTH